MTGKGKKEETCPITMIRVVSGTEPETPFSSIYEHPPKSLIAYWRSRPVYCKSLGSIRRSYLSAPVDRPRGQSGYGDEPAAVLRAVCGGSLSGPGQN